MILSGCSSTSKEEYGTLKACNDRLLAKIAQHPKTIGEKDTEIIRLEALCDSMVTKSGYDSAIKEKSLLQTKYNTADATPRNIRIRTLASRSFTVNRQL